MVYDCCVFDNELMMLELRLNVLSPVVDKFVIIEGSHTHQNRPKELCYLQHKNDDAFRKFKDKIIYLVYTEFCGIAWENERNQRKYANQIIKRLEPDDIVVMSDVDEIWNPEINLEEIDEPANPIQGLYYYGFNCRVANLNWVKSIISKKKHIFSVPELRHGVKGRIENGGWHYAYIMTAGQISAKLRRFAHTEYSTEPWTNVGRIQKQIDKRLDLFDRQNLYSFEVVPLDGPKYLMDNQEKYREFIF